MEAGPPIPSMGTSSVRVRTDWPGFQKSWKFIFSNLKMFVYAFEEVYCNEFRKEEVEPYSPKL